MSIKPGDHCCCYCDSPAWEGLRGIIPVRVWEQVSSERSTHIGDFFVVGPPPCTGIALRVVVSADHLGTRTELEQRFTGKGGAGVPPARSKPMEPQLALFG